MSEYNNYTQEELIACCENSWAEILDNRAELERLKGELTKLKQTPCKECGSEPFIADIARRMGHRPDIAYARVRKLEQQLDQATRWRPKIYNGSPGRNETVMGWDGSDWCQMHYNYPENKWDHEEPECWFHLSELLPPTGDETK